MKNKNSRSAFSLIEISMVLIVIAILFTGTIAANNLIAKSKLTSARSQTKSSVVASTKDLVAWFDSVSEKSFKDGENENETKISLWYDINPLSTKKHSASQATSGNQPLYKLNAINGLPALQFDGTTSYLEADYDFNLNPAQITIFAVVQTSAVNNYGAIVSSRNNSPYTGYTLYAAPNSPLDYEAWFGDGSTSWGDSSTPHSTIILEKPTIVAITHSNNMVKLYNNSALAGSASIDMVPNSTKSLRIGAGKNETTPDHFFKGYIGELIIFKRALSDEERKTIEDYLSKKWGIKLG